MMYEAMWANEQQTAVYLTFGGTWQEDDLLLAERDLKNLLSEVGHPVSVVLHIAEPRPISMQLMDNVRDLLKLDHPNRDKMVLVAPSGYLNGVQEVIRRIFGGTFPDYMRFAPSIADAEVALSR